ncbi:MAG: hypothetical protein CMM58_08800 [Rhodospirillaceae bacterium]|nr:hypothetical protein [Rhodospirillaceae bacterium]|tara:strand:- start:3325 stop:4788 length:1464 start_codon:yes stop_codon:yes gene_type:complete
MRTIFAIKKKIDRDPFFIFGILVLFIFDLGLFLKFLNWNFDDSYIVYRIVQNLLSGHGWVYNIGETYNASTSSLNTILITLVAKLTKDIPLSAHLLGACCIYIAGVCSFNILRSEFGNFVSIIGSVFLMHGLGFNWTWGLETNLFIALVLLFICLERQSRSQGWFILGLLTLARPDGIIFAGLKTCWFYLSVKRLPWRGWLIFTLVLIPWLIYSITNFGQISPDTLSQKVWQGESGYWGSGLVYLQGLGNKYFYQAGIWDLFRLGISLIGGYAILKTKNPLWYLLAFSATQQLAYVYLNVPAYHWYFAILDFTISFSFVYAISWIIKSSGVYPWFKFGGVARSIPFFALVFAIVIYTYRLQIERPTDKRDQAYKEISATISEKYGRKTTALVEVGTIGFYTENFIVDIVGLTSQLEQFVTLDRMDEFFLVSPDLILLHEPVGALEQSIYRDPRFRERYVRSEQFGVPGNYPMSLYSLRKPQSKPNLN